MVSIPTGMDKLFKRVAALNDGRNKIVKIVAVMDSRGNISHWTVEYTLIEPKTAPIALLVELVD